MRVTAFVLLTLVLPSGAAHAAEWALYSAMRSAPTTPQGVPAIWTMAETIFTEEGKCQTAAQTLAQEERVQTRCVVRVWRIYWQSPPTPIRPGRGESVGNIIKILNEGTGEAEIQRAKPTAETARAFDTEAECRAQLRQIQPRLPSPGGYDCIVETPNWR